MAIGHRHVLQGRHHVSRGGKGLAGLAMMAFACPALTCGMTQKSSRTTAASSGLVILKRGESVMENRKGKAAFMERLREFTLSPVNTG